MLEQKKPEYRKAVAIVKQFSADELAKAQYEQREKWRMDYSASMKYAAQNGRERGITEGLSQGLSQGLAKGKDERSFEIARSMKEKGIETSLIIELTGLSAAQIEALD